MSVSTHCLPSGVLGTNEIPVPSIATSNCTIMDPGGLRRGVIVFLHGMPTSPTSVPTIPIPIQDVGGFFPSKALTFANSLNSDGWIVIQPIYNLDTQLPYGSMALWNDINSDSGFGARYLTNTLHWWDHVADFIHKRWGNSMPIILYGGSWGGWMTLQIVTNKTSTVGAYMLRCAATLMEDISPAFTSPVDFTAITTTGADFSLHGLDNISLPGHISWGTSDPAVGFTDQQTLYTNAHNAGMPVTFYNGVGESHSFPTAAETDMFNWVQTTLEPIFPALY